MQSGIHVLDGLVPIIDCLMPFSSRNPLKQRHTLKKDQKNTTHPPGFHWCFNGDYLVGNYHLVNIQHHPKTQFFPDETSSLSWCCRHRPCHKSEASEAL
jgi:hypothetical protein